MSQELAQAPAVVSPDVEQAPPERGRGGAGNSAAAERQSRAGSGQPAAGGPTAAAATAPASGGAAQLVSDAAALSQFFTRDAEQALGALVAFRDAEVAQVVTAARTANLLNGFIDRLPSPPTAGATRTGMRRLLGVGSLQIAEAMSLFGRRFRHGMTNEQTAWRMEILTAVWDQLEKLPDQDVSGNTVLTTFNAINGGGGTGPSWHAPSTINTIRLGQAGSVASMSHTVRHEIGHAVHAQIASIVNPWLQGTMQFWFLNGDKSGVRQALEAVDAWPENYNEGTVCKTFGDAEKDKVAEAVNSWMGNAAWAPTRANVQDGQPAEFAALWAAVPAKMKNLVTQSTTHWYNNWANFQQGGGKSYFLNHYYHRPFHFNQAAAQVIRATGDNYSAMSEQEFFANAYAEYFKDPAGYADNSKWGGGLPTTVKEFFRANVLGRQPYTPPAQATPAAPATAAGSPIAARPRAEGTDEAANPAEAVAPPKPSEMRDATGAGQPT